MTSIKIHEFSTGIRPQINADGSWVSLGFTGQYMNTTIDPIPYAVERSIANKEFAVAEGAFSDRPAVIGRVVLDNENSDWSVVAVVSRGQDEKGRSASFYRYFLSEGRDNLSNLVAWMEDYERKNGYKPIFNPSETKVLGQVTEFNSQNPPYPRTDFVGNSDPTPIIIHSNERLTLQKINNLAIGKSNGQPVAWAFNAEALEKPWSFIVIQAASDRAYQILQRATANTPKVQTPVVVDEQALKSAIKSLMGSSAVKPEVMSVVADALGNNQVTQQYWENLFDGQGARNAINQKIYSPQMVRLLTLRALVIPQTLREYLDWLDINDKINKRNLNSNIVSSLEFQSNLRPILNEFPQFNTNIYQVFNQLKSLRRIPKIWEEIGDYCRDNLSDINLYSTYYRISAYFEQLKKGKVSKRIFDKAFPNSRSYRENIFGYQVVHENHFKNQGEPNIVPVTNVIVFVIGSFLIGGLSGFFIAEFSRSSEGDIKKTEQVKSSENNSKDSSLTNSDNNTSISPAVNSNYTPNEPIPDDKLPEAIKNFPKTSQAIKNIIKDVQEETTGNSGAIPPAISQDRIEENIRNILNDENLNFNALDGKINKDMTIIEPDKKAWIDAIYSYQKRKKLPKIAGYILPKEATIKLLNNELKLKNKSNTNNPPQG
jgi:hypothetical protein